MSLARSSLSDENRYKSRMGWGSPVEAVLREGDTDSQSNPLRWSVAVSRNDGLRVDGHGTTAQGEHEGGIPRVERVVPYGAQHLAPCFRPVVGLSQTEHENAFEVAEIQQRSLQRRDKDGLVTCL